MRAGYSQGHSSPNLDFCYTSPAKGGILGEDDLGTLFGPSVIYRCGSLSLPCAG